MTRASHGFFNSFYRLDQRLECFLVRVPKTRCIVPLRGETGIEAGRMVCIESLIEIAQRVFSVQPLNAGSGEARLISRRTNTIPREDNASRRMPQQTEFLGGSQVSENLPQETAVGPTPPLPPARKLPHDPERFPHARLKKSGSRHPAQDIPPGSRVPSGYELTPDLAAPNLFSNANRLIDALSKDRTP